MRIVGLGEKVYLTHLFDILQRRKAPCITSKRCAYAYNMKVIEFIGANRMSFESISERCLHLKAKSCPFNRDFVLNSSVACNIISFVNGEILS